MIKQKKTKKEVSNYTKKIATLLVEKKKSKFTAAEFAMFFSWIVSCIAFIIYVTVPKKVNLNVLPVERIKTM